jgi:hypothetical protein
MGVIMMGMMMLMGMPGGMVMMVVIMSMGMRSVLMTVVMCMRMGMGVHMVVRMFVTVVVMLMGMHMHVLMIMIVCIVFARFPDAYITVAASAGIAHKWWFLMIICTGQCAQ